MRKSLIIGFFAFFIALVFSKNTFAEDKKIYISRVYATDSKEFVELFNSGEDYKFKEISLKNKQKQIEIAKVQNGIFKSQEYITFAQNAQNSDVKFKEEFRNIDTIGQKPILGLYIDGELKDYICSDEKRCIKGFVKNSTDLKPSNKGVEKIAISKAEILKNGDKMTPIEDRNNYNFGLRNLDNYSPRFGGLKLEKTEKLNDKKDELEKNPEAPKIEDKAEGKKVLNPENEDSKKWKEENKANINEETDRCNKIKEENQERKCENGYFLNLETNRCNKILVEKATLECHEGYERNLETNRCRKISSAIVSKKDVLCATGYTRNPETNRCRKNSNEVKKELAPCKDGYERNEETNRCRKVVKNSGASDDVKKDEEKSKQAEFTGWWIIAVVILVFLAILFFEFRKDIFAKFSKGKK